MNRVTTNNLERVGRILTGMGKHSPEPFAVTRIMAESRRILAKSFGQVQKHGDFAYRRPGRNGVEFWHFGGVSLPPVAKHGEFAVFYWALGRALCARILAESFFVRKGLERVGRIITQNCKYSSNTFQIVRSDPIHRVLPRQHPMNRVTTNGLDEYLRKTEAKSLWRNDDSTLAKLGNSGT